MSPPSYNADILLTLGYREVFLQNVSRALFIKQLLHDMDHPSYASILLSVWFIVDVAHSDGMIFADDEINCIRTD